MTRPEPPSCLAVCDPGKWLNLSEPHLFKVGSAPASLPVPGHTPFSPLLTPSSSWRKVLTLVFPPSSQHRTPGTGFFSLQREEGIVLPLSPKAALKRADALHLCLVLTPPGSPGLCGLNQPRTVTVPIPLWPAAGKTFAAQGMGKAVP